MTVISATFGEDVEVTVTATDGLDRSTSVVKGVLVQQAPDVTSLDVEQTTQPDKARTMHALAQFELEVAIEDDSSCGDLSHEQDRCLAALGRARLVVRVATVFTTAGWKPKRSC